MSEARIDASVNLGDATLRDAQELQRALHEVFQDYEAEGQVAVIWDTREHKSDPFQQLAMGGQRPQQHHEHKPEPVEGDGQGQYL